MKIKRKRRWLGLLAFSVPAALVSASAISAVAMYCDLCWNFGVAWTPYSAGAQYGWTYGIAPIWYYPNITNVPNTYAQAECLWPYPVGYVTIYDSSGTYIDYGVDPNACD